MGSMEDLAALLAVGQAQKQAIANSDPYLGFQQAPDAISGMLLGAAGNPRYSTKEKVLGGLVTGLTSGLFGGLSNNYQARANQAYGDTVRAVASGQSPERPGVLNSTIFQDAQQQGTLFKANALAQEQDRLNKIIDVGLTERAKKAGELGAYGALPDGGGLLNPSLKAVGAEEDARRAEILGTGPAKALVNMTSAIPTLRDLADDDTTTSDIPFVYKFIQAQDGGIVRETEAGLVAGGNPLVSKFTAELSGALNGTSKLTPALKKQMVREMQQSAKAQYNSVKALSENILATGESRGANRGKMLPFTEDYIQSILDESYLGATTPTGGTGRMPTPQEAAAILAKRRGIIP